VLECGRIALTTTFVIVVFWLCRYPESHDFSDTHVLAVRLSGVSRDCSDCCVVVVQTPGSTTVLIVVFRL